MSNFTITAEQVIDTVIQDGQVQTTNRTNLLSFVNRVHLRMLRESQWLFLRSEEQRFITQPDVSSYWIGSGSPAPGTADTALHLTDVASIIPDYVFDLTNSRKLTSDSTSVLTGPTLRYKDGSYRSAPPRTYHHSYNIPNVLHLYPPPDNNNSYQPLPQSPICNFVSGGVLAWDRNYYILVTIVDSVGNESLPCILPSNVVVPAHNVLTVDEPKLEVASSAALVDYAAYNVYVATGNSGIFYLQNPLPVGIGSQWEEPATGVTNVVGPPSVFNILSTGGNRFTIAVEPDGTLVTTAVVGGIAPAPLFLVDSSNAIWQVEIDNNGLLIALPGTAPIEPNLVMADDMGNAWRLGVTTIGNLTTTNVGLASGFSYPAPLPPSVSGITPLLGYVISFHYQQQRTQITSPANSLQIPYQYFDVVVAGVNYYANMYTSKADDLGVKAGAWKREFMEGLAQMRRDLRINFRNNDVIMPDRSSQYEMGIQSGYSYEVQQ